MTFAQARGPPCRPDHEPLPPGPLVITSTTYASAVTNHSLLVAQIQNILAGHGRSCTRAVVDSNNNGHANFPFILQAPKLALTYVVEI